MMLEAMVVHYAIVEEYLRALIANFPPRCRGSSRRFTKKLGHDPIAVIYLVHLVVVRETYQQDSRANTHGAL